MAQFARYGLAEASSIASQSGDVAPLEPPVPLAPTVPEGRRNLAEPGFKVLPDRTPAHLSTPILVSYTLGSRK